MHFALLAMRDARSPGNATTEGLYETEARRLYNRALERLFLIAGGHRFRVDESWRSQFTRSAVQLQVRRDGDVWPPERFDELRFTGDFVVLGMDHHHGTDGLGVPLIGVRRPTKAELEARQGADRYTPFWEVYPVTAVLRFEHLGEPSSAVTLELYDTLRATETSLEGRPVTLRTDLTTPTVYHFSRGKLGRYERLSFFTPERLNREAGLHMLHPYERGKIPVVMIHGLASSPKEWGRVVDELRGDPRLRERYQFWMYMYPTGNPFLLSAAEFRKTLIEARHAVDPGATDQAYDQMVLFGHSMGGLLSRLAVTDSGDEFWRLNSNCPFDTIMGEPEHRELLGRVFMFEPLPFVKRVVFIATPHRGSKLGNQFIGRLADRLIQLPSPLEQAHATLVARNEPGFFTPLFLSGVPSSVDDLQLGNPYLTTLDHLDVAPWVTSHTIVGKLGNGPLEKSSDGVVPYTSSHVSWADSELVVPRSHACQDAKETIEELRRILFLHLSLAGGAPQGLAP